MKKVVLEVAFHNERTKHKAMKTASGILVVESISVDMKDRKMILSGNIDPVNAVLKLRKCCHTEIDTVEPEKEKEKKEEKQKVEPAKVVPQILYQMIPPPSSQGYFVSSEETPCGCVIC